MKAKMIYRPLTATPFKCNSAYKEIEPCRTLQPYIRCFWGGEYDCLNTGMEEHSEIVIPDTCVDIIYRMDDAGNIITSDFIGINDRSFCSQGNKKTGQRISVFAIRFYAWSAYVFSEDSFMGTVNGRYDVRERFSWLDKELHGLLFDLELTDMIRFAETLLLKKLDTARKNVVVDRVMNDILRHQGGLEVNRLSKENFISSRQMERLFCEYIGITPKKLSNLVRYQCLWRDIVSQSHFNTTEAVHKYGYTDASHLMREFKRYHSMNIRDAREMALR
ncbi:MAG: AraC family transcriptional regulator [Lachnospiraceae bacterium]|nr:AraC family transcriptional regulator [Lachnospiraceae bacterium]